jgi:hypothetical protein
VNLLNSALFEQNQTGENNGGYDHSVLARSMVVKGPVMIKFGDKLPPEQIVTHLVKGGTI